MDENIAREHVRKDSEDEFHGWRTEPDGSENEVWYYEGEGWITLDERFDLRQRYPRSAP